MNDLDGSKRELIETINKYATEYRIKRQQVIKIRNKMHLCLKKKNKEQAEAYEEVAKEITPTLYNLMTHIKILKGMLDHLNKVA